MLRAEMRVLHGSRMLRGWYCMRAVVRGLKDGCPICGPGQLWELVDTHSDGHHGLIRDVPSAGGVVPYIYAVPAAAQTSGQDVFYRSMKRVSTKHVYGAKMAIRSIRFILVMDNFCARARHVHEWRAAWERLRLSNAIWGAGTHIAGVRDNTASHSNELCSIISETKVCPRFDRVVAAAGDGGSQRAKSRDCLQETQ